MKKTVVILLLLLLPFIVTSQCQVVINEIFFSPTTDPANSMHDDANAAVTAEWIELYNPSPCTPIDISCWIIGSDESQTSGFTTVPVYGAFVFPAGTIIPPLGFIVIGGANATPKDFDTQNSPNYCGTRWLLVNGAGWVGLYSPNGTVIDAVYWSSTNAGALTTAQAFNNALNSRFSVPCACSGSTINPTLAKNIAGIEYAGTSTGGLGQGWKRVTDGSATWASESPTQTTPKACNGACILPLTIAISGTNPTCNSSGSASVTSSNGITPYTYSWNTGGTTSSVTGLSAGNYTCIVTDGCGCTKTATIAISSPPDIPTLTVNFASYCTGGSANLTASGANTYLWSPGTNLNTTTGSSVIASPTVTTTYTITGTSAAGCTAKITSIVTVNPKPAITVPAATICNGNSTTLTASGANTYTWSPATGLSSGTGTSVTANPTA
ncbi:MAG: lamin tail domain-containing protein, partial [Bacteroidota bacterium]